jgi:hypothetical protein
MTEPHRADHVGSLPHPATLLEARDAHKQGLIAERLVRYAQPVGREMVPSGLDPNGLPNRESLLYCYRLFRDLGAIPEPVSDAALAALWGTELVEEVLGEIGRVADR